MYWRILSENFIYFENLKASGIDLDNIEEKYIESLDVESITVDDLEQTLKIISVLN